MIAMPVSKRPQGFTIVELMLVTVIIGIVLSGLFYSFLTSYRIANNNQIQQSLSSGAQVAMGVIERDVRYSTGFSTTIASPFSDPYGPDNSGATWSYKGTPASANSRALILSAYATTQNPLSSSRQTIYENGVYACGSQMYYNIQLPYTVIYFVRGNVLYRRTLTDATTPICNGPQAQKQSCPPAVTPWNSICKAQDEVIAKNVTGLSIDYYQERATSPIINEYTSTNPGILGMADDAQVTLTLSGTGASSSLTSTISLRITKVNH